MRSTAAPAAIHLYKALLHLYPRTFRVEFGDEMALDFEEATTEARTTGGRTQVLAIWVTVAHDLIRTIAIQWLRSGLPLIVGASAAWTISFCLLIGQGVPRRDRWILMFPKNPDQEMQIMLLGLAVVVLLIAATVLITGWFWMFVVKRRSRA